MYLHTSDSVIVCLSPLAAFCSCYCPPTLHRFVSRSNRLFPLPFANGVMIKGGEAMGITRKVKKKHEQDFNISLTEVYLKLNHHFKKKLSHRSSFTVSYLFLQSAHNRYISINIIWDNKEKNHTEVCDTLQIKEDIFEG